MKGIRIRSIIKDSKDRLWFSTYSDFGLVRFDHGNLVTFGVDDGIPSKRVRAVSECSDGSYILHRVVGVGDGHYLIRGDNTYTPEIVPDSDVIGVLDGFQRKGREISADDRGYQTYVRLWDAVYPLRRWGFRCRRLTVGAARKLGILPVIKKMMGRS